MRRRIGNNEHLVTLHFIYYLQTVNSPSATSLSQVDQLRLGPHDDLRRTRLHEISHGKLPVPSGFFEVVRRVLVGRIQT